MTEPLCKDNKFYDRVCQVILFSLYFNKHTKLKDLRNTVDGILRLQSIVCTRRRYLESMYENIERQRTNNHMKVNRI